MMPDILTSLLRPSIVFFASLGLTALVRFYAKRLGLLMDVPDQRSSHLKPIPSGGGIAVVAALLASYLLLDFFIDLPHTLLFSLFVLGGGAALVGWIDDHGTLGWLPRLAIYSFLSITAVYLLQPILSLTIGRHAISLSFLAFPLSALGVLWMLNLYNFMDGIDGQATFTGIFVCGSILLMSHLGLVDKGPETSICLVLCAALLGFLPWNFPPAKIFLGDVGSCFLGFTFAVLLLSSVHQGRIELWTWLILFSHYIVDATTTLLLRIFRREPWTQPHRKHLFQRALMIFEKRFSNAGHTPKKNRTLSHLWVNGLFQGANVFFVFPCAYLAQASPENGFSLFGCAALTYLAFLLWADFLHAIDQD